MARKFPNKGLKGTTGRPSPGLIPAKPKIVIVCEGKVTEPRYFNDFTDHHGNSLVTVTTIGGCGVPLCVVERAVREKHALTHTARRSKDSYDQQFDVWAVFDRDAHPKPQVPQAFALAKRHGIRIAFSNPCFELWGLMHFTCVARPGSHKQTQRELKRLLPRFCHEKNPILDFDVLIPKYTQALSNATQALKDRELEGQTNGDPSTTVFRLTEQIRQFGKSQPVL